MLDLAEMIFFHARATPERPAIIIGEAALTYTVLRRGILSVQQKLAAHGVRAGSHVAICVNNVIAHLTLICALHRAGVTSVSLDRSQTELLDDIVADAVLTNYEFDVRGTRKIEIDDQWFDDKQADDSQPNWALVADPEQPCRLILSSGTTGRPKVIALTFGAVRERLISYAIRVSNPGWTRMVCMPGLGTNYGFSFAITALWLGRTVCFAQDANARQLILAHQAELLVASTHQIAALVQYQEQNFQRLDSLRSVHIGGAVAYVPLLARIRMLVCSNVFCGYGSTEGGTVAYASAEAIFGMDRAVGITVPWVETQVIDEREQPVAFGATGQVRLRALGQGIRFKKTPEGRYEREGSEWFYPGDQGIHYKNGLLMITGRINEMINRGGGKYSPDTIEEAIKRNPAILDAAAVGVLDALGIEQVWIAVVSRDGSELDIKKLYDYCHEHMPEFVPDRLFQVAEIPRNATGKISRVPLAEHLKKLEGDMSLALR